MEVRNDTQSEGIKSLGESLATHDPVDIFLRSTRHLSLDDIFPRLPGFVRKEISIDSNVFVPSIVMASFAAYTAFVAFSRFALASARLVGAASDLGFAPPFSTLVLLLFRVAQLHVL